MEEEKENHDHSVDTATVKTNISPDEKEGAWYKVSHIDNFRRNLIFSLWGGGSIGAVAGYCISVLKGTPIQLYMTSMTVTFGVGSMVFYGSYHYLQKGMGDSLWSWIISGATTGIIGGIITNPRYIPMTTLCFTGIGAIGYGCHLMSNRYYKLKQLRIRNENGLLTDEEKEEMKELKFFKKPKTPSWIPIKSGK